MNGKQATRLREVARRICQRSARSGSVTTSGTDAKGLLWYTVRNTGYRATYRNLKRTFLAVPRPERAVWIAGAMSYDPEMIGG